MASVEDMLEMLSHMSAGDIFRLCCASERVSIANGRISFHSWSHHNLTKVSGVLHLSNLIIQFRMQRW